MKKRLPFKDRHTGQVVMVEMPLGIHPRQCGADGKAACELSNGEEVKRFRAGPLDVAIVEPWTAVRALSWAELHQQYTPIPAVPDAPLLPPEVVT